MALRAGIGLIFGRAGFHAQGAAGAIFRGNLDGVLHAGEFLELGISGLEGLRAPSPAARIVHLCADDRMRANKGAFAALDAQVGFPDRDFERDIALFPLGGAGGEGAITGMR